MRVGNASGRAALMMVDGRALDIANVSQGRFSSDPQAMYERWDELVAWAATVDPDECEAIPDGVLGAPVPRPRQVFGIAANYRDHAAEAGFAPPTSPVIFTKFPSCLTGPFATVGLPSSHVDWEAELVVVVGRETRGLACADAWGSVAGLTIGQDLSERVLQRQGPLPQISMAKSLAGFGPIGPAVVTIDEVANPDDLQLGCAVNGEPVQNSRTSDLVFSVGELIEFISSLCTLYPGDLIFTGTPSGVGAARQPARFLATGDVLTTHVEGLGELRNTMTGADYQLPAARTGSTRNAGLR
jgi:2,4-diketo-3-deoxy-L-fuconate hydrolase